MIAFLILLFGFTQIKYHPIFDCLKKGGLCMLALRGCEHFVSAINKYLLFLKKILKSYVYLYN